MSLTRSDTMITKGAGLKVLDMSPDLKPHHDLRCVVMFQMLNRFCTGGETMTEWLNSTFF